jgi:hypothetical protein
MPTYVILSERSERQNGGAGAGGSGISHLFQVELFGGAGAGGSGISHLFQEKKMAERERFELSIHLRG